MPVNKPNQAYTSTINIVNRVRDFAAGNDTVKDKGELYLPRPNGQSNEQYNAYLKRGFVVPAVKTTAVALTGAIMRKDPQSEMPERLSYLKDNANGKGMDLSLMASMLCSELMLAGRYGLLGEVTETGVKIVGYNRESIINWSSNYIVLSQSYVEQDEKDKFTQHVKTEFLELTFDENGLYIQNIWREGKGAKWSIVNTKEPAVNGQRLNYLPFVFCNTIDATPDLTDPVLLHLADTNADQYRLSTDLRHGLHWTALPTLFVFGDLTDSDGNSKKLTIGAGSANHIQDNEASAMLLEFTGAGLSAIDTAINKSIETMASIGARLLQAPTKGVKSAETAKIEQSGETATLTTLADAASNAITNMLKILAEWSGVNGEEISYQLNKDFIDSSLTPQEIQAYLQALMSNSISLETFLNLLHKNEMLPEGVTVDDEIARIDQGGGDFNDNNGDQ